MIRLADVLLLYAEVTNELEGPTAEAVKYVDMIRERAGLEPLEAGKKANSYYFRTAIRNERRLELAFENQRFWDVRRWKDEQAMMRAAMGTRDGGKTAFEVESRVFMDYMIYGPIPYDEQMKGLEQNRGW